MCEQARWYECDVCVPGVCYLLLWGIKIGCTRNVLFGFWLHQPTHNCVIVLFMEHTHTHTFFVWIKLFEANWMNWKALDWCEAWAHQRRSTHREGNKMWNNRGDYRRPNTIKINLNYAHRERTLFSVSMTPAETRWCHASCWWRNIKRQLVWSSHWPKLVARSLHLHTATKQWCIFTCFTINLLVCVYVPFFAGTQHFLIENVEHKAHTGDRAEYTDTHWIAALQFQVTCHEIYMLYFAFVLFFPHTSFSLRVLFTQWALPKLNYNYGHGSIFLSLTVRVCVCVPVHMWTAILCHWNSSNENETVKTHGE